MPLFAAALLLLQGQTASTPIDFAQVWAKTRSAIERSYYARNSRKDEMVQRLTKYGPIASAARSKDEFRNIVDQMIGEFKDSHFDFLTDDDQGYYLMDGLANSQPASMPEFGAWFKTTAGGYTVQMVLNGSEAEQAGLRKGDIVPTVDGQPFSPVDSIRGDIGKTVALQVQRGSQLLDKKVKVESNTAMDMFLNATRESERIIDSDGHKIAYIHLWTQANDKFAAALSAAVYGKLSNTDAFILDLRDGFGGRPEKYSDPFFLPGVKLDWKFDNYATHQIVGYDKPLVVIINGGSRSAKEVLSFIFKASHRATLVGSNTAGNVLGTFPNRIAPWAYVEIPIVEVFANGVRLEGKGVAPDVQVREEFDSSGKDLDLDSALKVLNRRLSKH